MRTSQAIRLLVRVTSGVLFLALCWRAAPAGIQAFRYREFGLLQIYFGVGLLLILSVTGLESGLRSAATAQFRRSAVAVLLVACSLATAAGSEPGLLMYSLSGLAAFVACIGLLAAVLVSVAGNACLAKFSFWSVVFAAVAAGAWQVGVVPVIVAAIVRN